jgi:quercetin dioxygenase-like cupin family protein
MADKFPITDCDLDTSVPDWIIDHPQTLSVLREFGIDDSCGGKSLGYVCDQQSIDGKLVLKTLHQKIMSSENLKGDRLMAIPHANPGDVIDVRPLGPALAGTKTHTLVKADKFEVVRLVMVAGKELAEHKAPGEITVQCLEGKIAFTTLGKTEELAAGQMLYLNAGEPHSVRCIEDASFLLTILLKP